MSDLPISPGSRSLELLKVSELRDELRKRGLSLKGVKKELFERLEEVLKKEQEGEYGATQEDAHKPDGTEDFEEEHEALDETKDKSSKTHHMTNACPSNKLLSSCPSHAPLSTTDEATTISETHASSGVSAPDGVPGFINEDREQLSAAGAASVGTNNDVLFVDNAVYENGDAMPLPEKVSSVADTLEPGKEASGNHKTRPKIATTDLKASENVDGAPESGLALGVNVDNTVSVNDTCGTDCAMQDDENTSLLAGPEVVTDKVSKSEASIEVYPSEMDYKALMHPTLDSGLPVDKSHEEKEVIDLKSETSSVALEKSTADERDVIVNEKPDTKMEPMETDTGLEEKHGAEKPNVKMESMEVDAGLEDKHKLINEGNKEDPSQSKSPSQLKEVKFEKSSREYSGEGRGEESSSKVPDECKIGSRDKSDLKRVEGNSQACINVKRKDNEIDLTQEPAKRMRRWNSGKEVTVDVLKPLTTDTVKEIILPESTEGSFVAGQRLTPKAVATSRELPPKLKVETDSDNTRTVPPSTRAPSNSLKIERFVRPFTLKAVKDLLGEFGQCVDFWMDQIKTHCFVTYSSVNEAVAARSGLYGKKWPPSVGNFLVADFVDSNEVKIRSEGLAEKTPPTAPLRNANTTPPPRVVQSAPLFRSSSNTLQPSRFSRETQLPPLPKKDPEPAGLTLEDLFFKTKTKPSIYYLPLTDEQVVKKLAAAKNKRATM